ncbi:MAG: class II fructose-1,6-bisphosphate aldolase [Deltaproteobacteria bacterium]|nr:MAG: class II fructose-1,6-bisphosphate aldolase [Deltaproteobacteria bacterium]
MGLVTGKEILEVANRDGYAVGAFNINNLEILQGVVAGCIEKNSPVIIAVSEGAIKYAGFDYIVAMVKTAAELSPIPIALHLDHGRDKEIIYRCIKGGFTSVMIDASHLPLEENIKETKVVVEMAHAEGISVEGELGRLKGVEETVSVAEREATLTDPQQAERFVEETGVDFLAPAIGTSHGAFKFKGEAKLDLERLKEIKRRLGIPLVLHGASTVPQRILELALKYGADLKEAKGVPSEQLKKAIALGINKINTDTDLRLAFTGAVRKVLAENPGVFDPRKILGPARDMIAEVVKEKISLFGSSGKARSR